ncbi:MAG TPA: efflux RND transporter periplasmic adaptor subunit [Rhizomicrobium sp.]|jgi:multidrug efflux system membrane fusion protein
MSHIVDLARTTQFDARKVPERRTSELKRRALLGVAAFVLLAGLGIAAWRDRAGSSPAPAAAAPVPVTVAAVGAKPVRLWSEFSGRMTAVDSADVRPEVNGRITEIRFHDGQQVRAGDILLVIDPRTYEAAEAKAEADLATAQTNARLARTELDRATRLLDAQAVARDFFDQRSNASAVANASVQSAVAALAQTKLDVEHAYVRAPISGRVGRAEITVGNLVQASASAPVLTTIVSDDGIYADFDVDEQTYLRNVRAHATTAAQEERIPVELTAQGDAEHVYRGAIESFDNRIDTGTGTIRARARFANEDGRLVPGMFVSVKLASATDSKVILVPEDAIGNDQSKRFVFVVGSGDKALFREVALGQEVNGDRVVVSGLRPGEKIIVDGTQRVAPGEIVAPRPVRSLAEATVPHQFASR